MASKSPTASGTPSGTRIARGPVIAILGHIDHGKSTLLDYIRKSNVAETEAGGITQQLSAYEVTHKSKDGGERAITFLDTPGHEAFVAMRSRGVAVADIAILVVSAEEGVKAQTLEGLKVIKEAGIPFIVAITKIDKPQADIERTKHSLLENEIYLEGLGGDIPYVPLSSKTGEGVPELLDMMLLVADLQELSAHPSEKPVGVVIEANLDPKKGIAATLIIKDGILTSGSFIVAGDAIAPTRIMQNFLGRPIKEARPSQPVLVIGWDKIPVVGAAIQTFDKKRDAEEAVQATAAPRTTTIAAKGELDTAVVPLVIKADTVGTLDAISHELEKVLQDRVQIKILQKGTGSISEGDIKPALGIPNTIVISFNTRIDPTAADLARRSNIPIHEFNVIYKLTEWLVEELVRRRPMRKEMEITGQAKILKIFSKTKDRQIFGGRVSSGMLAVGNSVKIKRRDVDLGEGALMNLQQQKADTKKVEHGEFGGELKSKVEIAPGDTIDCFIIVEK